MKIVAVTGIRTSSGSCLRSVSSPISPIVTVPGWWSMQLNSSPCTSVDVEALGADFVAFSSHKMLGPTGIGVLWGKMAALEETEPFEGGGEMISDVTLHDATWGGHPPSLRAGTPPIIEAVGLHAAIDYLESIGMDQVLAHDLELTGIALDRLSDVPGIRIQGPLPSEDRGGVVSMSMDGVHAHDLATILDEGGVAVRSVHHCAKPLMRRLGVAATAEPASTSTTPRRTSTPWLRWPSPGRRVVRGRIVSLEDLYREVILDRYRNPRERRSSGEPRGQSRGVNPLCGDELTSGSTSRASASPRWRSMGGVARSVSRRRR